MRAERAPALLTWDEVGPARHAFDSAPAGAVVRSLGPARPASPGGPAAGRLEPVQGRTLDPRHAARDLILYVADRTGCGSGWHRHCLQVLTWFLARWGVAPESAGELVDEAFGGRFASWTGPDPELVEDVAERLAPSLPPDGDGDGGWLAVRAAVPCHEAPDGGHVTPIWDGVARTAASSTAPSAPPAPRACPPPWSGCGLTPRGAPLDFALLQGWQRCASQPA
ncbi:hypothetical protein ACFY71_13885 [Streptomyces cinerochromogenes]|uniref:hypothetical protein n=1 Tax=Streptomyces cinerochromogenes TaxID=66422 RepID=UPI00368F7259